MPDNNDDKNKPSENNEHPEAAINDQLLFVYGTLMREENLSAYLNDAEFIGEAETTPDYTLVNIGPYPAVVPVGDHSIKGELYKVSEQKLDDLDFIEGVPYLFKRGEVSLLDGQKATCYVLPEHKLRGVPKKLRQDIIIQNGTWRDR